jgi:hypothetical protein
MDDGRSINSANGNCGSPREEGQNFAKKVLLARVLKKAICKTSSQMGKPRMAQVIIREGKGRLSIVAIPPPKTKRTYKATAVLEKKLREAKNSKELDCPPEFFIESLDD